MADEKRKLIFELEINDTKLNIELGKVSGQLKDARDLQKGLMSELDKTRRGTKEYDNLAKALGRNELQIKKLTQAAKETHRAIALESSVPGSYNELKLQIAQTKDELNNLAIGSEDFAKKQEELNKLLQKEVDIRKEQPSLFQTRINAAIEESEVLQKQAEATEKLAKGVNGAAEAGASFTKILGGNAEALEKVSGQTAFLLKGFQGVKDAVDAVAVAKKADAESTQKLTLAQKAYSLVVGQSTGAMKGFRIALAATGVGLLVIALAALISNFDKISKWASNIIDKFKPLRVAVDAVSNAFTFLGEKLGFIASENEKKLQATIDGVDELISKNNARFEREAKLLEASGVNAEEIEKKKLKAQLDAIQETIVALKTKQAISGDLEEEELKKLKELQEQRLDVINESLVLEAKIKKEAADKQTEEDKKAAEKAKDLAKQRAEARIEAERMLRDIQISLISDKTTREVTALNEQAKREKESVNKSLASEQQKADLILLIEQKLTADLQALYKERFETLSEEELKRTQQILTDEFALREIALKERFASGEIKEKEYNDKLVELNRERLNQELADLQDYALTVEGVDQLIAQKKIEIANFTADQAIAAKKRETDEQVKLDQKQIESAKQKADLTQSFIEGVGGAFTDALEDQELDIEKFQKNIVLLALDTLQKLINVQIASATAQSLAQPDSVATFGATGLLRAAVLTGLINAAFAVVKSQIASFYDGGFSDDGGYTGDGNPRSESTTVGKKPYIYHKKEYIVPAKVLATSQGFQHVQALENMRLNMSAMYTNLPGFADGGFADRAAAGSPEVVNVASLVLEILQNAKFVVAVESITEAQGIQTKIVQRAQI